MNKKHTEVGYEWAGEHFCVPDATRLYHTEPGRLADHGHPVGLTTPPRPETFCSICLKWFDPPHQGSDHRPPQEEPHERNA